MNETKFTPGPWIVTNSHYPSFKEISGPSFGIKVVMWATGLTEDDYQKRSADLHLIAAAPDMYKELEEALNVFRFYQFHHASKGHSEKEQNNKQYADNIEKVLAKARW